MSAPKLDSRVVGEKAYGSIVGIVSVEPVEDLVDVKEEAMLGMEAIIVFLGLERG